MFSKVKNIILDRLSMVLKPETGAQGSFGLFFQVRNLEVLALALASLLAARDALAKYCKRPRDPRWSFRADPGVYLQCYLLVLTGFFNRMSHYFQLHFLFVQLSLVLPTENRKGRNDTWSKLCQNAFTLKALARVLTK